MSGLQPDRKPPLPRGPESSPFLDSLFRLSHPEPGCRHLGSLQADLVTEPVYVCNRRLALGLEPLRPLGDRCLLVRGPLSCRDRILEGAVESRQTSSVACQILLHRGVALTLVGGLPPQPLPLPLHLPEVPPAILEFLLQPNNVAGGPGDCRRLLGLLRG